MRKLIFGFLITMIGCASYEPSYNDTTPWWILNASSGQCELAIIENQNANPKMWIVEEGCKYKLKEDNIVVLTCAKGSLYILFGRTFNDCEKLRKQVERAQQDRSVKEMLQKDSINYKHEIAEDNTNIEDGHKSN